MKTKIERVFIPQKRGYGFTCRFILKVKRHWWNIKWELITNKFGQPALFVSEENVNKYIELMKEGRV